MKIRRNMKVGVRRLKQRNPQRNPMKIRKQKIDEMHDASAKRQERIEGMREAFNQMMAAVICLEYGWYGGPASDAERWRKIRKDHPKMHKLARKVWKTIWREAHAVDPRKKVRVGDLVSDEYGNPAVIRKIHKDGRRFTVDQTDGRKIINNDGYEIQPLP
jgi:hypothetical protein